MPHSADAPVNTTTPVRNSRRRPNRSASRPDTTRKAANTMLYAFSTQDSVEIVVEANDPWIAGNATFTIVESTNSMNTPSAATASTTSGDTARRTAGGVRATALV